MQSKFKQLRIIVFFDLPMDEKEEIKQYTNFKKSLRKIGFYQLQYSIYVKVVQNENGYKKVIRNIRNDLPTKGQIRILKITEKQYESMLVLQGGRNAHELLIGDKELVIFSGDENE